MSSAKDLPDRARAVIVGGGVTGCSIAYHLAHLGWTDIVLLEQHELTAGTTWHAAGLITSAGMTDETALFLSRYSRDLYERLEKETGHSTGFNPVGHVSLATNPQRLEALRRSSAWMHGFGVTEHEITARELQDMWPLLDTSDVLAGFYVPDEGRADPVGVATSMAKGAKALGARVIQGVTVKGVETKRGRVTAVDTDQGRIETEVVVNAAGMWARQLGERDGVCIPLQAAEHYYLITDTVPGMDSRPGGDRGPRPLRLLPARGRRHAGRSVRAGGRARGRWTGCRTTSPSAPCRRTGTASAPTWTPRSRAFRRCPKSVCGCSSAARSPSPRTSVRCSGRPPNWTATTWRPE